MTDPHSRVGQTFAQYRVVEKLGSGGMGVVYKGEDTRLHRLVALKFLPDESATDPSALARFRREAEAASSLNHPHICTIYDIVEHNGESVIAMEYIEGQTLKEKIGAQLLPLATTLDLAIQIADALGAAHQKGIVHRDVKPSNIFITTRGDVKLLDFGLAKHLHSDASASAEDAPTISEPLTLRGQIVGTVAYMSPEQAQDKPIDARSDIFSLGAVIYEMATGRRAFTGDSAAALIAEILRSEPPPIALLNSVAPTELQRIISKALEKDREDRYQTAADLIVDLRCLKREQLGSLHVDAPSTGKVHVSSATTPKRLSKLWLLAAIFAIAIAAEVIAVLTFNRSVPRELSSEQLTFSNELKSGPIATDGSRLYFQMNSHSVAMSVKGGPTAPLSADLAGMRIVDISPDASEFLAIQLLLTNQVGVGTLWSVATLGGSPERLGNIEAVSAVWSPDGRKIVFHDLNSISITEANGDSPKQIWKSGDVFVESPHFSPDAQRIRFSDNGRLWEMHADGANAHALALDGPEHGDQREGQWTPDGKHFVFLSNRNRLNAIYELVQPPWFRFWRKPFAVQLSGAQLTVESMTPSRDGSGLFLIGGIPQGAMQFYDEKVQRFTPYKDGLNASVLLVSPDRQWIAYTDYPRHFLWRMRLDGSEKIQLSSVYCFLPRWAPDSKSIVFSDSDNIYRVSVDGGTTEKLTSAAGEVSPSFSADGKSITFSDIPTPGHLDGVKVLDLATKQVSAMPGTAGFYIPSWSPDGQSLVAVTDNPPRLMVYSSKTNEWRVLRNLDSYWTYWTWSPDSKSILIPMPAAAGGSEPAKGATPGIYRLTIADGKWDRVATFDGLTLSSSDTEGQPGIDPDGRLLMMSDTSVLQIYFAKWPDPSSTH